MFGYLWLSYCFPIFVLVARGLVRVQKQPQRLAYSSIQPVVRRISRPGMPR